jgi:hypothetical protein
LLHATFTICVGDRYVDRRTRCRVAQNSEASMDWFRALAHSFDPVSANAGRPADVIESMPVVGDFGVEPRQPHF